MLNIRSYIETVFTRPSLLETPIDTNEIFTNEGNYGEVTEDIEEAQEEAYEILTEDEFKRIERRAEGALTENTRRGYQSQINQWQQFLKDKFPVYIEDFERPSPITPKLIAVWIFAKCGLPDDKEQGLKIRPEGKSYSHAQKMRASLTWHYGLKQKLGSQVFTVDLDGRCSGNPVLHYFVSTYMTALRREKTRAGIGSQSVRAISYEVLTKLFEQNARYNITNIRRPEQNRSNEEVILIGGRARVQLYLIYAIAFVCLLRFDEVLRIQWEDIQIVNFDKGGVKLSLRWRKTAQYGEIQPFIFWNNRSFPPINISSLLFDHFARTKESQRSGPLFRHFNQYDMPEENLALSQSTFMSQFRANLREIYEDDFLYGTHSFRRGGCQYWFYDRRWDIRKICIWGGWSQNFDANAIFRYLYSENDAQNYRREDILNPEVNIGQSCSTCHRSCDCRF